MDIQPLLSISCITYNHAPFIKTCLDGFLMQQTSFAFEVVIHDDASTDGTREIIEEYTSKYPDIFFPMYQKENQYSQGVRGMMARFNFPRCRGKYIALCEGDDYWTDPLKLQKQVDFLETNLEYGICFHNVLQLNTFDISKNDVIPNIVQNIDYDLEDYILNNKTATCSIVFKKEYLNSIPNWFSKVPFGDLALILYIMYNSNKIGHVLKGIMGVYRIHEGGIHGSFHKNNKSLIEAYLQHIQFTKVISKEFLVEKKYRKSILKKLLDTYKTLANLYLKEEDKLNWIKIKCFIKYYTFKIKFTS